MHNQWTMSRLPSLNSCCMLAAETPSTADPRCTCWVQAPKITILTRARRARETVAAALHHNNTRCDVENMDCANSLPALTTVAFARNS